MKRERYNVVVLGDSLGDGTWAGLYHVLRKDKRFNVIKKSKVATGFSRHDYYDWNQAVREIAAETRIDIAIVVMGTNDRQAIVENGKRHALFDDNWRAVYKQRVDDFTTTLKNTGAQIYWLELPVMRSPRFGGDMEQFNEIFEERARLNNITFVQTDGLATGSRWRLHRLWRRPLRPHAIAARGRRYPLHDGRIRTARRAHCRCDAFRSRRRGGCGDATRFAGSRCIEGQRYARGRARKGCKL